MLISEINKLRMENLVMRDAIRIAVIALGTAEGELREIIQSGDGSNKTRETLLKVQRAATKLSFNCNLTPEPPPEAA